MPHTDKSRFGFGMSYRQSDPETKNLYDYINLKLAARGFRIVGREEDFPFLDMGRSLLANFQERLRLLAHHLPPADARIDAFLRDFLSDLPEDAKPTEAPLVPSSSLILEKHGIARTLSIPPDSDTFKSPIVESFRVYQGVCHNPAKDRRTTKGVFHVTEGGLPIPGDKLAAPKIAFARLLQAALHPPGDLLAIPFTANQDEPVREFISLLLRPTVSPKVPGKASHRSLEVRFFAPGNLVSNLDFVESIFGNAGDPHLPENDSALDVEHWTGHTGCVILAPHLVTLRKKDVGLPHISEATPRQVRDGMCWEKEDDLYNGGSAFKITARDKRGVIVTLIADNYFGYCKKEVKTQISFAANLFGNAEEEHAGGAIAFPSFDHGDYFALNPRDKYINHTFADVQRALGDVIETHPTGYGTDKRYPDIVYVPAKAVIDLDSQWVSWPMGDTSAGIPLRYGTTYVYPSGYKVEMTKPSAGQRWRLVGCQAEGTLCHKPCTVSGGGKSEISKTLSDAMTVGPVIIPRFQETMKRVREVVERNYWDRYHEPRKTAESSRPLLDQKRSIGSILYLLTPNPDFTDAHNAFVASLPTEVIELVLVVKRHYKPDWGPWENWAHKFSVDVIDGAPGYEVKFENKHVMTRYLRVGFTADGLWRTFRLRKDFLPCVKQQREDDITASTILPVTHADGLHPQLPEGPAKFVANCEYRLFQRPDDAVHRGYDKTTERDFSSPGNFFSNYEPISREEAREIVSDAVRFDEFTAPMQDTITAFVKSKGPGYIVSSAHPRIVGKNGERSENPRYLQIRPDLEDERGEYLAEIGMRLFRRIPVGDPILAPVNATIPGRRNNPPDAAKGIRALAVYGPIHYQELPELFMDFIASLTGKSPSTTGAGSEGALTKGPFNALLPITDLNAALLSFVLTRQPCFTSAAGYIGPNFRVDHDISLIIPEVWSRMHIWERDPVWLRKEGMLEKIDDFEHHGSPVLASRLGYRITEKFVDRFFGRMFSEPASVFSDEMLRPEKQDPDSYADGVNNIVETQQKVARNYFDDGSIHFACPPLKAILHIMVHGNFNGEAIESPAVRNLFDHDTILTSDWYADRLEAKASVDRSLWKRHVAALRAFTANEIYSSEVERLQLAARLKNAEAAEEAANGHDYAASLKGTLGTDPSLL
jgi:hypothetical protein